MSVPAYTPESASSPLSDWIQLRAAAMTGLRPLIPGMPATADTPCLALLFWSGAAQVRATALIAPDTWRRGLAFTLDGLRPEAATSLPAGPLGPDQVLEAMHHLAEG